MNYFIFIDTQVYFSLFIIMSSIKVSPLSLSHLTNNKIIKKLGEGTDTCIYLCKCHDIHDDNLCQDLFVVKHMTTKNSRLLMYNEYNNAIVFNHKNIISILDIDIFNHKLIYENVVGIDLLDLCNANTNFCKYDITMLLNMFQQILRGVLHMHNQRIAHIDLKLENVLWCESLQLVKIIDFGHSHMYKDIHNRDRPIEAIKGTPNYFPPEYFIDKPYQFIPTQIDSWCVGIILYNIIYDHFPWIISDDLKTIDPMFFHHIDAMNYDNTLYDKIFHIYRFEKFTANDYILTRKLFKGLLHPNPHKRMTISKALDLVDLYSFLI